MDTTETSLPVVESTPAVNAPEPSASPSPVAPTPAAPAEDKVIAMLTEMEKRMAQSARDAAKAAVNKALGVKNQPAPAPAPAPAATTPAPTVPVAPTPAPEPVQMPADPVLVGAYEYLQKDGVNVSEGVDMGVLEAYRIQAANKVHITVDMPEFKMIDGSSLSSYLRTTEAAVLAAKERMIEEGTYQEGPDIAQVPGAMIGKPVTKLIHEKMTGSETLEHYFTKGR